MAESASKSQSTALLFLHAQTPLHPGSGTAMGVVDLPVQRERHTQWPLIPGSALKGILRDVCREQAAQARFEGDRRAANESDADLIAVFGPGLVDDANAFVGALSVTDARILAFPVRSLKGVFAWVSCPTLLARLVRDGRMGDFTTIPEFPGKIGEGQAACAAQSPLLIGDHLVLEEFEFSRVAEAGPIAEWLAGNAIIDDVTRRRFEQHFVILSDDEFSHFVRHATEVVARIGLDYDQKTVRRGALFYEEFIPTESVFYALALAANSRGQAQPMAARQVLAYLQEHLPPVLQVGADETIGKGFCTPNLLLTGGNGHE